MRVVLTEESHNHVDWEVKSALVRIELGILVGTAIVCTVLFTSPGELRWAVGGAVAAASVAAMIVFALTTPLSENGHMERLPDGGDLKRTQKWLFVRPRPSLDLALADLVAIEREDMVFEDAAPVTYRVARIWAVEAGGDRHLLTPWVAPESADALAPALRRAARFSNPS